MAIFDRVRGVAGRAGEALRSFSAARAAPAVPGVGMPLQAPYVANQAQQRKAEAFDALFGRLTYTAGPTHTRYSTYPGSGLTPAMVNAVLQEANNGLPYRWADLWEQVIERDPHMASVDHSRRVEVTSKPHRVHAVLEDPLALTLQNLGAAVFDQIDSFDAAAYALQSANGIGYSLGEIVYVEDRIEFPSDDGRKIVVPGIWPRSIEWVHPKHIQFDRDTDEPLLNMGSGGVMRLPEFKFVFHAAAGHGFYERRGYLRRVIWYHLFKQSVWRDWMILSETYGIPQLLGKYPSNHDQLAELQAIYQTVLQDIGKGKPAIVPDEFKTEWSPTVSAGGADSLHSVLVGAINAEISKAIQGETLTTEMTAGGIGSYNASDTHAAVKHRWAEMDARALADDERRDVLGAALRLNARRIADALGASPGQLARRLPRVSRRIERETTPIQRAQIADIFANKLGMELDAGQLRDDFGFNVPRPGGERTRGAPVPVPDGAQVVGSTEASRGVDNPKPDEQPASKPEPPKEQDT